MLCLLWQWIGCSRGGWEGKTAIREGQGPPRSLALLHPLAETDAGASVCVGPACVLELLAARKTMTTSRLRMSV